MEGGCVSEWGSSFRLPRRRLPQARTGAGNGDLTGRLVELYGLTFARSVLPVGRMQDLEFT
eukprot:5315718-Pyramimonas_sp.AAC.1